MEKFYTRKIDEQGRLVIPIEIRKNEQWDAAKTLAFTRIKDLGIIHLSGQAFEPAQIDLKTDELGRTLFPLDIRRELGWGLRAEVSFFCVGDFVFLKK